VVRVVDGDTVVLEEIGTVRLIGIDTPETVDPRVPVQAFGMEASAHLSRLLTGQRVRLEYDQQRQDKYGRTLAYLHLPNGTFVNLEMVRQGYAHAYVKYPFQLMEFFRDAEREARAAGRGLWATSETAIQPAISTPSGSVRVWVNTSSRVYHCPGTRYYGKTARGAFMTEAEANVKGHRPAYGRRCGPETDPTTPTEASPPRALATAQPPAPNADVKVWVNTSSGIYHCPGTRYYGNTKRGAFMTESAARSDGHRPAGGRSCR
jgi:micrococcal nuclease